MDALRARGVTRYRTTGLELELGALEKPSKELTSDERDKLAEAARTREIDVEWAHVPGGPPPWVKNPLALNRQVPGDEDEDPS